MDKLKQDLVKPIKNSPYTVTVKDAYKNLAKSERWKKKWKQY